MNGFVETQHEALGIMGHVAENAIPALNVRLKDPCRYVQHMLLCSPNGKGCARQHLH